MARLRSKTNGCPWDLEQTMQSLRSFLLEETYELLETMDRDDHGAQREELGDLLLQVIFQSQIASENGWFNFSEVVDGITRKLLRRHPHIFGNQTAKTANDVVNTWDKIKKREKNKPEPSILDGVPKSLPSLSAAHKLSDRASRCGFDWENPKQVMHKLEEELSELKEAMEQDPDNQSTAQMAWELGDLLFSVANLARHLGLCAEDLLREANQRFQTRFRLVEQIAREQDIHLGESDIDTLEALWQEAKARLTEP